SKALSDEADMADTITHTWQTVEQAAVTLNVSTRTIARRLANGSLETRVDENGRRLVMVQQIGIGDTADTGSELAVSNDDSDLAAPTISAGPSSQAMTMLSVLQSTVSAARDDATAARRSAKWAWGGVGFMTVAIIAAAVVLGSVLTRSSVTTEMLTGQLVETKTELKQTQAELMATRTAEAQATRDLTEARKVADAQRLQAERQMAAADVAVRQNITGIATPAAKPVAATPTTQPQAGSLVNRLVSLFGE
ncbi:MAG: hypothetical protein JWM57_3301, partial [Phycisphaerales bacterium]|nr:hypothetical protein [Phycisphaerales bacterium]